VGTRTIVVDPVLGRGCRFLSVCRKCEFRRSCCDESVVLEAEEEEERLEKSRTTSPPTIKGTAYCAGDIISVKTAKQGEREREFCCGIGSKLLFPN